MSYRSKAHREQSDEMRERNRRECSMEGRSSCSNSGRD
jgi:hypothetical protein